jgi:NADH-quinone oxidoreductase subunit M
MASIGLPGTNGFVAEVADAARDCCRYHPAWRWWRGGVILGAAYFLGFFQRAFLGPVASPELAFALDLRPRELLVAGVLGLLVLIGGLFPQWVQGSRRAPAAPGWRGWRQGNRWKVPRPRRVIMHTNSNHRSDPPCPIFTNY